MACISSSVEKVVNYANPCHALLREMGMPARVKSMA